MGLHSLHFIGTCIFIVVLLIGIGYYYNIED